MRSCHRRVRLEVKQGSPLKGLALWLSDRVREPSPLLRSPNVERAVGLDASQALQTHSGHTGRTLSTGVPLLRVGARMETRVTVHA